MSSQNRPKRLYMMPTETPASLFASTSALTSGLTCPTSMTSSPVLMIAIPRPASASPRMLATRTIPTITMRATICMRSTLSPRERAR